MRSFFQSCNTKLRQPLHVILHTCSFGSREIVIKHQNHSMKPHPSCIQMFSVLSISCSQPSRNHVPRFESRLQQPCHVAHVHITHPFLLQYCKKEDRRTLVDLLYQDDQFLNSGNAYVQDSYSEKFSLLLYQHAHSPYWFIHLSLNTGRVIDNFVLIDNFIHMICLFFFPGEILLWSKLG